MIYLLVIHLLDSYTKTAINNNDIIKYIIVLTNYIYIYQYISYIS